jgi:hypothetical protein
MQIHMLYPMESTHFPLISRMLNVCTLSFQYVQIVTYMDLGTCSGSLKHQVWFGARLGPGSWLGVWVVAPLIIKRSRFGLSDPPWMNGTLKYKFWSTQHITHTHTHTHTHTQTHTHCRLSPTRVPHKPFCRCCSMHPPRCSWALSWAPSRSLLTTCLQIWRVSRGFLLLLCFFPIVKGDEAVATPPVSKGNERLEWMRLVWGKFWWEVTLDRGVICIINVQFIDRMLPSYLLLAATQHWYLALAGHPLRCEVPTLKPTYRPAKAIRTGELAARGIPSQVPIPSQGFDVEWRQRLWCRVAAKRS